MSAWEPKPGDVAVVTTVVEDQGARAVRRGGVWHWLDREGYSLDDYVRDARPLVVIDPESDETADAIAKALVEAMYRAGDHASAANGCHPATIKAALRSLLAPPKPDEPTGLGAVVEDERGERWVLIDGDQSARWCRGGAFPQRWRDLSAVRVLSEGVAE